MANLAVLLLDAGRTDDALVWARIATVTAPDYANAHRIRGKVALAAHRPDEARSAFAHAVALEPDNAVNRLDLALALIALHQFADAKVLLEGCASDRAIGIRARELLATLPRGSL
jgi:predicted negative regulator of RcsB-dependent stress response